MIDPNMSELCICNTLRPQPARNISVIKYIALLEEVVNNPTEHEYQLCKLCVNWMPGSLWNASIGMTYTGYKMYVSKQSDCCYGNHVTFETVELKGFHLLRIRTAKVNIHPD